MLIQDGALDILNAVSRVFGMPLALAGNSFAFRLSCRLSSYTSRSGVRRVFCMSSTSTGACRQIHSDFLTDNTTSTAQLALVLLNWHLPETTLSLWDKGK